MCVFCKIVNKELPSKIEYEDEKYMAFYDINPKAPIHLLIIPKKHVENLNDMDESDISMISDMALLAKNLAKKLGIDKSGYRIVINNGPDSGQEVYHIHMHLLGGNFLGSKLFAKI
ncbi:MAG: histidine triad nucleotide-binding protein [Desulfurella sp.]|jgi:histidine triad (HIT) family protein|uniref:Histidine triad (HIT) family protein n=1 Tax=Desulfurella multipotens TaxID=79269 RepID=A0A1G6I722_9BACT|nr:MULTISPECIES: histidine triad nucleotide-binding protein [Desulfurella]AHF97442.1 HIT family hydrolase [Desulfurella acetivorans A63]HEX13888.1 histidine triad nucleotide-binding protein [Desulfurella acetivorans]PMP65346.1 MAG: histidine triad nucleotide-binding protein [Desulfurella multipotens]PMP92113.1 MAG: histidine triad nucleotide-binding protein [Desulfurella sp.]SDC01805.1 histidine triad (HIT) family protein [Desulfurella multipotens]